MAQLSELASSNGDIDSAVQSFQLIGFMTAHLTSNHAMERTPDRRMSRLK